MNKRWKHPRTSHLPWSPGATDDDRVMRDTAVLDAAARIIVTEKMDGEQTTMYHDAIHARSLDGRSHPSRDWVKNLWGRVRHDIPASLRVCGENLYATHSIHYDALPTYFMAHSVWEGSVCLPWDETMEWLGFIGLKFVPILYDGPPGRILHDPKEWWDAWVNVKPEMEGYVVRIADGFPMNQYHRAVGKYVRTGHVKTQNHWTRSWVPNKLRKDGA